MTRLFPKWNTKKRIERKVMMLQTVLFVCLHGAAKSRMAAAFFNQVAPAGWTAISAGVEPQAELGQTAIRLLAGTSAQPFLDTTLPRPITAVNAPAHTVAIDCKVAAEAEEWELNHQQFDETMREELQTRVEVFAAKLGHTSTQE
jgi:protein-tyrosine-phosphatase